MSDAFDIVRDLVSRHRLLTERRPNTLPDTLKCSCGMPFLRPENWDRHLAEVIVGEESLWSKSRE